MKKILTLLVIALLISCSSDDDESTRTMYSVSYTVRATNGATINKIEYRDENGDLIEVNSPSSPWTINLRIRAGLAVEARAYGDVPYQGELSLSGTWTPDGGSGEGESHSLPNNDPSTIINNGMLEIEGRTLPDL